MANGFHLCVNADGQVVASIVLIPIAYLTLDHQGRGHAHEPGSLRVNYCYM